MPIENYVRVTHYPNITIDDFKSHNQDDRYLTPLRNLFEILDQLHIRYVYMTATVTIGDKKNDNTGNCKYEKEVELGIYLPDLDFLLNFPSLGAMGVFLNVGSISFSELKIKNGVKIYDIYKFINGVNL